MYRTKIFGHRGWSAAYPENTIAAFLGAIEVGVDGIEFDVHRTRDGEIVVIHDETVDRTTDGFGHVEEYTLAEIQQLDAGGWFSPEWAGQRIPALQDVLDLVLATPRPVEMNIEIKVGRNPYDNLGEDVWQRVKHAGLSEQTVLSSFNHYALRDVKSAHPEARIAVLYSEGLVDPWVYAAYLRAEGVHPFYMTFDAPIVEGIHRASQVIRPFTVNQVEDMQRMLDWGVDGLITDHPDVCLKLHRPFA